MPDLIDRMYFQQLSALEPVEVCTRARCAYDGTDRYYTVAVWDQDYRVYPHLMKIEPAGDGSERLHPYFDLFIVHYLLRAKAIEPAGQWISEKDIPGGATFFRGPHAIPTECISNRFGNDLPAFKRRCQQLRGLPLALADAAYIFAIAPRISVAALYWRGDEEFPAEAGILFDRTIAQHLATDIVFAVAVGICERLGAASGRTSDR
jgi:hypothetical protein